MTPVAPSFEGDFTFAVEEPFPLESGGTLQPVTLRYVLYGHPNARRDNVVLVCHALSGSARAAEWWTDLFGPGLPFDTERVCVLGINILGSCYGSTGPASIDPRTGEAYGPDFPLVSINDMVRAQARLLDHLGIERLHAVAGGSIGGLQALAWAIEYPERVGRAIVIGACPLNAMGLALSHLQRQAIVSDPAWRGGRYPASQPPKAGLALARALATCSYKSNELFNARYGRRPNRNGEDPRRRLDHRFDVAGYLDYQGRVFLDRFDANSYLVISKAMDNFHLGHDAAQEEAALRRIRAKMLLIGISTDWLFPPNEVRELAERMRGAGVAASYKELATTHGHDGFLADARDMAPLLLDALQAT